MTGAFYLEREADHDVAAVLLDGQPCHVLASRQVGKSSLKVHTIQTLRGHGRRVASADLSALGTESVTEDAWCYSLARTLFKSARSGLNLSALWDSNPRETISSRLDTSLRALATEDQTHPLVIFLDEIDLLISLPFRVNVLRTLRALLNDRAEATELKGFTICLIGVALAVDVAPDLNHSPFIGRSIELRDFTRDELQPLEAGLRDLGEAPELLLDSVFSWTRGHPAFTQHLCAELVVQGNRDEPARIRVEVLVQRSFLEAGRHQDQILVDIDRRFLEQSVRTAKMLTRYRAVLAGVATEQGHDDVQEALRIAGLVRIQSRRVLPRNRIIASVFDRTWVDPKISNRRFTRAMEAWLDEGRRPSALLAGERLKEALEWARQHPELTNEEHAFLDASRSEEQEREREQRDRAVAKNRQRSILIGLLLALLVAVSMGFVVAWSAQRRAESEARRAGTAERSARMQREAALREAARAGAAERKALFEAQRATSEAARAGTETERADAHARREALARQALTNVQPRLRELRASVTNSNWAIAECEQELRRLTSDLATSSNSIAECRTNAEQVSNNLRTANATLSLCTTERAELRTALRECQRLLPTTPVRPSPEQRAIEIRQPTPEQSHSDSILTNQ
jgi:AAA-like domain